MSLNTSGRTCVKARSKYQVSFSVTVHHISVYDRVSHWTWSAPFHPEHLRGSPASAPLCRSYPSSPPQISFYKVGAGDSNLHPRACTTGTLPVAPSLQPHLRNSFEDSIPLSERPCLLSHVSSHNVQQRIDNTLTPNMISTFRPANLIREPVSMWRAIERVWEDRSEGNIKPEKRFQCSLQHPDGVVYLSKSWHGVQLHPKHRIYPTHRILNRWGLDTLKHS